jgi:hypothetical protein
VDDRSLERIAKALLIELGSKEILTSWNYGTNVARWILTAIGRRFYT